MAARKPKNKRSFRRFAIYLLLIILGLLVGGFIGFARHVEKLSTPESVNAADGIVVWTGKGGDRLMAAGNLLDRVLGERLLISGVNKALSEEEVYELLSIGVDKGTCCVDIDYKALDTIGNARETRHWIKSLGYEHIILVTSDYHMPRAIMEIQNLSGRVRITPYPVVKKANIVWWKDGPRRSRLLREYGKLLLSYLRNSGSKAQREAPELPELPAKDSDK